MAEPQPAEEHVWCLLLVLRQRRCKQQHEGRGADDGDLPGSILCANLVSRIPYFMVPNPTNDVYPVFLYTLKINDDEQLHYMSAKCSISINYLLF